MALQDGINTQVLSHIYTDWYAKLIDREKFLSNDVSISHPHYLLKNGLNAKENLQGNFLNIQLIYEKPEVINLEVLYTNSVLLKEEFASVAVFETLFKSLPPVSNGNMFLDVGNTPRLFIGKKKTYVVVKVKSLDEYVFNYFLMKKVFNKSKLENIDVVDNVGFIKTKESEYFMSEFKGNDFEIEILLNNKKELKELLVESARKIENLFNSENIFVRNIAPRNMIYNHGKVFVIDYDNIYLIPETSIEKLWELDLQRKVWFGDILSVDNIEKIFPENVFKVDESIKVVPDHFEKKFFNEELIRLEDRKFLYKKTELLEQGSLFKGTEIYGHQLGRYISDFWEESSEVNLLRFITDYPELTDELRALLFITSRIDQELLFYHSYSKLLEIEPLGEEILKKILKSKVIPNFDKLCNAYIKKDSFEDSYALMQDLLK
jgi:hypothetical protein